MKELNIVASFIYRNIHENLEILLLKRPRGGSEELSWENPGGKMEDGESHEDTLYRELNEEIGLQKEDIINFENFHQHDATYPDLVCHVTTYLTEVTDSFVPELSEEHLGHNWFSVDELDDIPLLSGMEHLMPKIKEFMNVKDG